MRSGVSDCAREKFLCCHYLYKDKESEDSTSPVTTTPRMFLVCGSEFYFCFLWSTFYTSLLQLLGRPKKSVACFYFLSIFFRVSYPRSSPIGTQSKIGHMLRSESALRIHAQNLGCTSFKNWGPKQPALDVYRRLRNLTAKIFGTEQDTDKLTTRKQRFKLRKVPYVQSKFDEI